MELRHIRYFVAVAESLSFTRAAERVHVTQSTLSHQIKQLEEEVGRQLFDRIGKRVVLTEAGGLFLSYASRALREIDQGVGVIKQSSGELIGVVRIGTTHTLNLGFIPACVASFIGRHPTVQIVVQELSADAINSQVKLGELDIGIAYKPIGHSEIHFEALYNEEMVLVVGEQHAYARRKRIRMVELHRQRMAMLPSEFATRIMLDECFRACGAVPSIVVEMNTIAPILGLVARSEISAIVARSAVPGNVGVIAIPLESPTPVRTPGVLWRTQTKHTVQVQAFTAIVRQLALEIPLKPGLA